MEKISYIYYVTNQLKTMTTTDLFFAIIIVPMTLGALALGIAILYDTLRHWGESDDDYKRRTGF